MIRVLSTICGKAGKTWCKMMHPDPMWPVKGKYICPTCQRTYPVPWESEPVVAVANESAPGSNVLPIRAPGRAVA
jgi:hypothetical protein